VTVNSLVRALPDAVKQMTQEAEASEQRVVVSSMSGDAVLFELAEPPFVSVKVEFHPEEAARLAVFEIRDTEGVLIDVAEGSQLSGIRMLILRAGSYTVRITFLTPGVARAVTPNEKVVQFIASLVPPRAVWYVEVPT
jgi:hypothetical protein